MEQAEGVSVVLKRKEHSCGITSAFIDIAEYQRREDSAPVVRAAKKVVSAEREVELRELPVGFHRCMVKSPVPRVAREAATQGPPDLLPLTEDMSTTSIANELERRIVDEINAVRGSPMDYAGRILKWQRLLVGTTLWTPDGGVRVTEGSAVFSDAAGALESAASVPPIGPVPAIGLCLAARDLALDIGPKGLETHRSTDECTVMNRVERYGRWRGNLYELVSFGWGTPEEIVLQLLIDDGVPRRVHRQMLLDGRFKEIGICLAPHRAHRFVCVIVLASQYVTRPHKELLVEHAAHVSPAIDDVCAKCFAVVDRSKCVFGADGKQYHRNCFICTICKSTLRYNYFVQKGAVFCGDCVAFRHPQKCSKCGAKITKWPELRLGDELTCEDCFLDAAVMLHFQYRHNDPIEIV